MSCITVILCLESCQLCGNCASGAQDFSLGLERREEVVSVIGQRAEFLAFANCVMVRQHE